MSVTDQIVDDIVRLCKKEGTKTISRIIVREDYIEGYAAEFVDEIEEKLKAKGITIGA